VRLNGVIEAEEQQMPTGVLRLAFRSAYALITPRRDVETVNSGPPCAKRRTTSANPAAPACRCATLKPKVWLALRRLPLRIDQVTAEGYRFEAINLNDHRTGKGLVGKVWRG